MGYKTRSNYMPGYGLTQDRFDFIFKKGKYDESSKTDVTKDEPANGTMEAKKQSSE